MRERLRVAAVIGCGSVRRPADDLGAIPRVPCVNTEVLRRLETDGDVIVSREVFTERKRDRSDIEFDGAAGCAQSAYLKEVGTATVVLREEEPVAIAKNFVDVEKLGDDVVGAAIGDIIFPPSNS